MRPTCRSAALTVERATRRLMFVHGARLFTITGAETLVLALASLAAASAPGPFFARPTVFAVAPVPAALAVDDVNGDGKPDVVTAADGISVLINKGDGSFGRRRDCRRRANLETASVAIGDLNGDRKPEVVTANSRTSTVSVYLNRGAGTFGAPADYRSGTGPNDVALADVDAD